MDTKEIFVSNIYASSGHIAGDKAVMIGGLHKAKILDIMG